MKYVGTERFSPVIYEHDLPWNADYFHLSPDSITKDYLESGEWQIDEGWWYEQKQRCLNGYTVKNATDTNLDVWIPGRYYFYLNFWPIRRVIDEASGRKDVSNPKFLDFQLQHYLEIERMYTEKKNLQVQKTRQRGYSEMEAAHGGHEYSFYPGSQVVIVAGEEKYTDNTMGMTLRGLDHLINTQFYKERSINRTDKIQSRNTKSEIYARTAKINTQVVSGLSPSLIIFEEIGIWKKGYVKEVYGYVEPSLKSRGNKVGYGLFIGCVCAGTKVWTGSGKLINVEDLEKEDGILGYDGQGFSKEPISNINLPKLKECYRITTTGGNVLECSYDHPIMTSINRWVDIRTKNGKRKKIGKRVTFTKTEDILVGDQLITLTDVPLFGNEKIKDARLIGLMIGDGNYSTGNTPCLACAEDSIYDYLKDNYDISTYKHWKQTNGTDYRYVGVKGSSKILRKAGIYMQSKYSKRLPSNIDKYDKESLAELIGGYFDADGNVKYNKRKDHVNVCLSSICYDLLEQVKYYLHKFGIGSIIMKEYSKGGYSDGHTIYRLYIGKTEDVILFKENIPLLSPNKNAVLEMVNEKKKRRKRIDNAVYVQNKDNKKGKYFIGKDDLKNLSYETVSSIEYIGEKEVYNLTADRTHTYIANGFVTANTGGDMEEGVADAEEMFYNPALFDCLEFDGNLYEKNQTDVKTSMFIPSHLFRVIDKDGNSLKEESLIDIEKDRATRSGERLYQLIITEPLYASESFMASSSGFFGEEVILACNARKAYIRTHKEAQVAKRITIMWKDRMDWTKGVVWEYNDEGDFLMSEPPREDAKGNVYSNLYVAGTDSYDQDEAHHSTSKGSCWVKKKFLSADDTANKYVAGIVLRPTTAEGGAERFFEKTAMLCAMYNAKNLIEWSKIRIFDYYIKNNWTGMLKERPDFVTANIIKNSLATNKYGIDPSTKIHWLKYQAAYLNDLNHIESCDFIELLDAWANYKYDPSGKKYNCDITISTSLCEVYLKDEEALEVYSEGTRNKRKRSYHEIGPNGELIKKYR